MPTNYLKRLDNWLCVNQPGFWRLRINVVLVALIGSWFWCIAAVPLFVKSFDGIMQLFARSGLLLLPLISAGNGGALSLYFGAPLMAALLFFKHLRIPGCTNIADPSFRSPSHFAITSICIVVIFNHMLATISGLAVTMYSSPNSEAPLILHSIAPAIFERPGDIERLLIILAVLFIAASNLATLLKLRLLGADYFDMLMTVGSRIVIVLSLTASATVLALLSGMVDPSRIKDSGPLASPIVALAYLAYEIALAAREGLGGLRDRYTLGRLAFVWLILEFAPMSFILANLLRLYFEGSPQPSGAQADGSVSAWLFVAFVYLVYSTVVSELMTRWYAHLSCRPITILKR